MSFSYKTHNDCLFLQLFMVPALVRVLCPLRGRNHLCLLPLMVPQFINEIILSVIALFILTELNEKKLKKEVIVKIL